MCRDIPWKGDIIYYPSGLYISLLQACARDIIWAAEANLAEVSMELSWDGFSLKCLTFCS